MKKQFETSKLYLGYPVYILGYKDEHHDYNITTQSSSYSLGNMMVVGMSLEGNAAQQIKKYGQFTLNVATENMMLELEQAGMNHGRDKFSLTKMAYKIAETIDAPVLDLSPVVIECQVEQLVEYGKYLNIIAKITRRWVDTNMLNDRGYFDSKLFNPIEYMGDEKARYYRYLDHVRVDKLGTFIKQNRNK